MNTGTARIVIIVALLVTGGLLLANGFGDTGLAAADGPTDGGTTPSPSASASPTDGQEPQSPEPPPDAAAPKDTIVAVFNGTSTTGLGAIVMGDLVDDGYLSGQDPGDMPQKPVEKTTVYFVGGQEADQNEANAVALADKHFKGAKVRELSADLGVDVERGVQVVVVVGLNDAAA